MVRWYDIWLPNSVVDNMNVPIMLQRFGHPPLLVSSIRTKSQKTDGSKYWVDNVFPRETKELLRDHKYIGNDDFN